MLTSLQMVHPQNWGRVWGDLMAKVFADEFAPGSLKTAASAVPQVVRSQTLGELSQAIFKQVDAALVHDIYLNLETQILPQDDIISPQLREEYDAN